MEDSYSEDETPGAKRRKGASFSAPHVLFCANNLTSGPVSDDEVKRSKPGHGSKRPRTEPSAPQRAMPDKKRADHIRRRQQREEERKLEKEKMQQARAQQFEEEIIAEGRAAQGSHICPHLFIQCY